LIGRTVHTIYAPSLQVAGKHLTAPSLALPVLEDRIHRYAVVRCRWSETPHTYTDYWEVLVSSEDKPGGFEVNSENALVEPCTINFFDATPINRIEIFSFEWSAGEGHRLETVEYDRAIRFQLEDGSAFCISCQLDGPGIATEVHISEDEGTIRQFLQGSRLRLTVKP
jgi:hypothetical protein